MMFYGVLWCFMMFYDVLCLKSLFGFLLSERTSGVSLVIFIYCGRRKVGSFPQWSLSVVSHIFWTTSQLRRTHLLQKSPNHDRVESDDDEQWEEVAKDKEAHLGANKAFQPGKITGIEDFVQCHCFMKQVIVLKCLAYLRSFLLHESVLQTATKF